MGTGTPVKERTGPPAPSSSPEARPHATDRVKALVLLGLTRPVYVRRA
ncbi:hypothetical protein ACN28S_67470 [Cystobacter fuscus]